MDEKKLLNEPEILRYQEIVDQNLYPHMIKFTENLETQGGFQVNFDMMINYCIEGEDNQDITKRLDALSIIFDNVPVLTEKGELPELELTQSKIIQTDDITYFFDIFYDDLNNNYIVVPDTMDNKLFESLSILSFELIPQDNFITKEQRENFNKIRNTKGFIETNNFKLPEEKEALVNNA